MSKHCGSVLLFKVITEICDASTVCDMNVDRMPSHISIISVYSYVSLVTKWFSGMREKFKPPYHAFKGRSTRLFLHFNWAWRNRKRSYHDLNLNGSCAPTFRRNIPAIFSRRNCEALQKHEDLGYAEMLLMKKSGFTLQTLKQTRPLNQRKRDTLLLRRTV